MAGYLHPHEVDYYADPADVERAYPQLLERTRATAERAALLIRQVTALRAENDRLRERADGPSNTPALQGGDQT